MNIFKTYLILLLIISAFSGQSQATTIKVEEIQNEDLKLILTGLSGEKTARFSDEKRYFFINTHKVLKNSHFLVEEGFIEEVYYFATGSYDEYAYKEARVYRTEDLINPKIESIEDSKNSKNFIITISYIDRSNLKDRTRSVITLPKYRIIK